MAEDPKEPKEKEERQDKNENPVESDPGEDQPVPEDVAVETDAPDADEPPEEQDELPQENDLQAESLHPSPRSTVIPLVAGGVVAALLGYGVSFLTPGGWPLTGQSDAIAVLEERQTTADTQISELNTRLAALPDADAIVAPLAQSISENSEQLRALVSELAENHQTLSARIEELEKRPIAGEAASEAAVAAYQRDLEMLQADFDSQRAGIEQALASAEAESSRAHSDTKSAAIVEALSSIATAIDNGTSYAAQLDALSALDISVSDDLTVHANGVTTMSALRADFPAVARAAIDASTRAGVADGSVSRLQGFLRTQLGARSLEPKEGDSTDAILSRAENALTGGRLDQALTETTALGDVALAQMADWLSVATARQQALTAFADFKDRQLNATQVAE